MLREATTQVATADTDMRKGRGAAAPFLAI